MKKLYIFIIGLIFIYNFNVFAGTEITLDMLKNAQDINYIIPDQTKLESTIKDPYIEEITEEQKQQNAFDFIKEYDEKQIKVVETKVKQKEKSLLQKIIDFIKNIFNFKGGN